MGFLKYQILLLFLWSTGISFGQKSLQTTPHPVYEGRVLDKDSYLKNVREELEVIQIKNGDTIADIGAGSCVLEATLFLQYQHLTVFVNDIDKNKLAILKPLLDSLKTQGDSTNHFYPILGNDTSTGLQGTTFHKVIIRDALHHFRYPDKILAEVRQLLKPNGLLVLSEMLKGETRFPVYCGMLFERKVFVDLLLRNGYYLVKESKLEHKNLIVFEYKLKDD